MREVPACIDEDGRLSFTKIAERAQVERVNWYAVISLGAQAFVRSRKVEDSATEGQ